MKDSADLHLEVDSRAVRAQLDRILATVEFVRSPRMAEFLRFVVEQQLTGAADPLKERTIGVAVFGKQPDWDPKQDTIVRSEARRLRAKLDGYYESAGHAATLRISIPKGGYCPVFEAVTQPPAILPARRPLWWMAGAAACAAVGLTMLWAARNPVEARSENFWVVPFVGAFGEEFSPALSPDASRIAYVWDGDGSNLDIYVKRVADGQVTRLTTGPEADLNPAWSPDGKQLAFLRVAGAASQVIVRDAGGVESVVSKFTPKLGAWTGDGGPLVGNPGPVWTRDAKSLILWDGGLVAIQIENGARKLLTSLDGENLDFYPRVSPDGDTLAFVRYSTHGLGEVFTMPLAGGRPLQITNDHRTVSGLAWTSDGQHLAFVSSRKGVSSIWTVPRAGGAPQRVPGTDSAAGVSIAAKGDTMAFAVTRENWNIWRASIANDRLVTQQRFLASSGRNHTPRFSPDGKRIAFVSDRSGAWEIWTADSGGAKPTRLTHFDGPWLGGLHWSPDSSQLVFDARPEGHSAIFVVDAGGGKPRLLERTLSEDRVPDWSHDGKYIYFLSNRGGSNEVWRRDLASGATLRLSPPGAFYLEESHDGNWVYFGGPNGELRGVHPDGTGLNLLPAAAHYSPHLSWTASSLGLCLTRQTDATGLKFELFRDGKLISLGASDGRLVDSMPSVDISRDGRWLLFTRKDHITSDINIRRGPLPR